MIECVRSKCFLSLEQEKELQLKYLEIETRECLHCVPLRGSQGYENTTPFWGNTRKEGEQQMEFDKIEKFPKGQCIADATSRGHSNL